MPPAAQRQQWLKALRDLLSAEREALIDAISQTSATAAPMKPCSPN
jgi:acyl-CoA reductase-like NAD-dependent aldehyde dehydrogenase